MNTCDGCKLPQERENGDYWVFVCVNYGTPEQSSLCDECYCDYTGTAPIEIQFGKPSRKVVKVNGQPVTQQMTLFEENEYGS